MSNLAEQVTGAMLLQMEGSGMLSEETEQAIAQARAEQPQPVPQPQPQPDPEDAATPGEQVVEEARAGTEIVEIPAELAAELDEPDFEEEAEQELVQYNEAPDEQFEDVSYEMDDSPELQAERKARIAAEKKAAHYENLRASEARRGWKAEAEKYFPYAKHRLDTIEATSRKGFLRAAKAEHEAVLPYITQAASAEALEAEREKIRAEEKAAAIDRWGGHPGAGPSATEGGRSYEQELDEARATGNLEKVIGVLRRKGQEGT